MRTDESNGKEKAKTKAEIYAATQTEFHADRELAGNLPTGNASGPNS